jgi:hypothetical protein
MTDNKENNNFKKIGFGDKEIVKSKIIKLIYKYPEIVYNIKFSILSKEDVKELEELSKFLTI